MKFDEKKGFVNSDTRTAYQSYLEKQVSNGQEVMVTKYKPVNYTDYSGKSSVAIDFQLKLVSLKTGELLRTKMINKKMEDEIHYARSDASRDNLFPGSDGRVETASDRVQSFRGLFTARKELKSVGDLTTEAYNQTAKEMANDVKALMLELVK